jgi:MipA family protein
MNHSSLLKTSFVLGTIMASMLAHNVQAEFGPEKKVGWNWTMSVGPMYMPAFLGSDQYQTMLFPDLKVEYDDVFFASLFEGTGYNLINNDTWRAGPILKFDFGRQEEDSNPFKLSGDDTTALLGLGDIDMTPELGGFVEYNLGPLSYSLEVRQGIGGHEGLVGETALKLMVPAGPVFMIIGPRATFGDETYNNAFFGITPTQSLKSGLAPFTASSGMVSYGAEVLAFLPITDTLTLGLFGRYEQISSDLAESPLIKERGDDQQSMFGIRLNYEF